MQIIVTKMQVCLAWHTKATVDTIYASQIGKKPSVCNFHWQGFEEAFSCFTGPLITGNVLTTYSDYKDMVFVLCYHSWCELPCEQGNSQWPRLN